MSKSSSIPSYSDTRELLQHSELTDVVVYEVGGRRVDEAVDPSFTLQILTLLEGAELEIRCKVEAQGQGGQYLADAGAVFTLETAGEIPEEIQREFAEKVGVMAIYPYVRSTVSQLAASLGLDRPVLPLLRAGSVTLNNQAQESEPGD